MANEVRKLEVIAGRAGIVFEETVRKQSRLLWRIFAISVIVIAAGAIVAVIVLFTHRQRVHTANVAKQKQLQQQLTDVNAVGDLDTLKQDSNTLINGAKDGTFSVSNKQLAQAYANRGDAEFNQGDEKAAIADYEQAVKLDGGQQALVGYNEFVARYHLGERASLVPLLKTLQAPYKNNYDIGMQDQYAQYQKYIDDLQAGKELDI